METTSGNLASALKIEPGITAIIGSGGKSTLLRALGLELMRAGGFPSPAYHGTGRIVAWTPRLGSRGPCMFPAAPARHARA